MPESTAALDPGALVDEYLRRHMIPDPDYVDRYVVGMAGSARWMSGTTAPSGC